LFSFFDSEATLQKRLTDKSGDTVNTDLEEFMALEQIRANKAELERMMTYNGRAGLLEDWRAFQVKAARQREALKREAAIAQAKKKKQIAETIWLTVLAVVLACTLYFSVLMIDVVRTKQ
jgi:hypothetical protein